MQSKNFQISGNIVDVVSREIFKGIISVKNGKISKIDKVDNVSDRYIMPGLIDSHIHIESSMLTPAEFARIAVVHGTVATVSDPHEIANVLGINGVDFMIDNGNKTNFKFFFGAPSCVPATPFETSGATLNLDEIEILLQNPNIKYLSEMMNYPGVLFNDEEVMDKISLAKKYDKPIDGHSPNLFGEDAQKYISSGISTDHECFTIDEAIEKIKYGMTIQIREGSAAKNFESLIDLLAKYPDKVMFCSDDKHPDDLIKSHINELFIRAIKKGYNPIDVLRACTFNPIKHYNLNVGLLQIGDDADMLIVDNLTNFNILETYINGIKVAEKGKSLLNKINDNSPNIFNAIQISSGELLVDNNKKNVKVIKVNEGQLITDSLLYKPDENSNHINSNTVEDILKIVVINRYSKSKPSIAFINGFGLKEGAIASTVAHDSHNIIAVGTNDNDIAAAINLIITHKGGISVCNNNEKHILPLPVAGLMTDDDAYITAEKYEMIDKKAKDLGSKLNSPFMTLSFMALLVIPKLKISDKGLFDAEKFCFTTIESEK